MHKQTIVMAIATGIHGKSSTCEVVRFVASFPYSEVITKNGYGEAVMMSIKLYEEMFAKMQTAALINSALDEIDAGAKPESGEEFFGRMKEK